MGNQGTSGSLLTKNWHRVSQDVLRNVITQELIQQSRFSLQNTEQKDNLSLQCRRRVNKSHPHVVKLIYFSFSTSKSNCSYNFGAVNAQLYTEYMPTTLALFESKNTPMPLETDCICSSIISGCIYLQEHYGSFQLNEDMVFLQYNAGQNKRSRRMMAKVWINPSVQSCEPKQPCSEDQMCLSILLVLRKVCERGICQKSQIRQVNTKYKFSLADVRKLVINCHKTSSRSKVSAENLISKNNGSIKEVSTAHPAQNNGCKKAIFNVLNQESQAQRCLRSQSALVKSDNPQNVQYRSANNTFVNSPFLDKDNSLQQSFHKKLNFVSSPFAETKQTTDTLSFAHEPITHYKVNFSYSGSATRKTQNAPQRVNASTSLMHSPKANVVVFEQVSQQNALIPIINPLIRPHIVERTKKIVNFSFQPIPVSTPASREPSRRSSGAGNIQSQKNITQAKQDQEQSRIVSFAPYPHNAKVHSSSIGMSITGQDAQKVPQQATFIDKRQMIGQHKQEPSINPTTSRSPPKNEAPGAANENNNYTAVRQEVKIKQKRASYQEQKSQAAKVRSKQLSKNYNKYLQKFKEITKPKQTTNNFVISEREEIMPNASKKIAQSGKINRISLEGQQISYFNQQPMAVGVSTPNLTTGQGESSNPSKKVKKIAQQKFESKRKKELIDSLSNGDVRETQSIYNQSEYSRRNVAVPKTSSEGLTKQNRRIVEKIQLQKDLEREKQIIKLEMQVLFKNNMAGSDQYTIKQKVKHKKATFAELKAQASKILDDFNF